MFRAAHMSKQIGGVGHSPLRTAPPGFISDGDMRMGTVGRVWPGVLPLQIPECGSPLLRTETPVFPACFH